MNEIEEAVATCLQVYDMVNKSEFSEYIDAPEKGFITALKELGFTIVPNSILEHECWDGDNFIARPFDELSRNS